MKDIRRVFEFHGAEHKVVFNFESGKPVNVENAQSFVTWHPRCGTSFMFVIMLIRDLIYTLLPFNIGRQTDGADHFPPVHRRHQLRTDPVRGQASRFFLATADGPGLWTAAHHDESPRPISRRKSQFMRSTARWRLKAKQGGELVIA